MLCFALCKVWATHISEAFSKKNSSISRRYPKGEMMNGNDLVLIMGEIVHPKDNRCCLRLAVVSRKQGYDLDNPVLGTVLTGG